MKTKHVLFSVFMLGSSFITAQTADKKIAVGLNVIRNEYNGDYGSAIFNFKQKNNPSLGLSVNYFLSPSFDLGVRGSYGDYGYIETVADQFSGAKLDASLFANYKLNNGYILSKDAKLSPFLSLGLGFAKYYTNNDATPYPTIITNGTDFIVPLGAGLKYQISNSIALQYQYLYNITNSDVHDNNRSGGVNNVYFGTASHPGIVKGNDAFGQHIVSLVIGLGKLKDTDKDGIADKFDNCFDTPLNVVVDKVGCPVDGDGDGVADYLDACAETPAGVQVDAKGCPVDTDKDGVADYLDKCNNTPSGVKVDAAGCPVDKDGDNVADYLDKCSATPAGVKVDNSGCPVDTDGDGVADYLDKCSGTPASAKGKVDASGCPLDSDGDGVADYLDKCPKIAGEATNNGCPEVKKEAKQLFQRALQGIQFQTGKADIKPASFNLLNQIANVLTLNPTYLIEVQGHTDNVGKPASNLALSQSRAASVRQYLISKGVKESRITSQGFGDSKPVADNKTTAGKALNRRVEFVVSFEQ